MTAAVSVGNWSAILVLVLFMLSNAAVISPVCIAIPQVLQKRFRNALVSCGILPPQSGLLRKRYLCLDFINVPLFSVLLLLATRAINGAIIRDGVVGANGVKPLDIMGLFMSLAYISISLDATGLLRFLAFWVVRKGGSSGRKLFTYLYGFFLIFGVLVGNDPVILSGTVFLAYMTRASGINTPTAWIYSQFVAANMASVVLVSSNQTNLVLAGAFSIPFTTYFAHCILPFLCAAVLVYPVFILGIFRSPELIPPSVNIDIANTEEVDATLHDPRGAIFGSILLLITLGVLVGTSTIGVAVWEVTVPPAVIMLIRDLYHDWTTARPTVPLPSAQDETPEDCGIMLEIVKKQLPQFTPPPSSPLGETLSPDTKPGKDLLSRMTRAYHVVTDPFPTVVSIAKRLPVPLVPFALLMFILVQSLAAKGWVDVFARWWGAWVDKTGTLGAVGGMGMLACLACNVCGTNIGATILLARVIQIWQADAAPSARTLDGAIYALAFASNYGAYTLTFSASLAGLLWRRILLQKGIRVRPLQFLLLNLPISFTAMLASCVVLVGQLYVIYGRG